MLRQPALHHRPSGRSLRVSLPFLSCATAGHGSPGPGLSPVAQYSISRARPAKLVGQEPLLLPIPWRALAVCDPYRGLGSGVVPFNQQ